jgi:hypothetical protein
MTRDKEEGMNTLRMGLSTLGIIMKERLMEKEFF